MKLSSLHKYLFLVLLPSFVLIVFIGNYLGKSYTTNFKEDYFKAQQQEDNYLLGKLQFYNLQAYPDSVELYYHFHNTYSNSDAAELKLLTYFLNKEVNGIKSWMDSLAFNPLITNHNIPFYNKVFYSFFNVSDPLNDLNSMDTTQKYFHFTNALLHTKKGNFDLAVEELIKEVEVNPQNKLVYIYFTALLKSENNFDKVDALISLKSPDAGIELEKLYYYDKGSVFKYIQVVFRQYFFNSNAYSIIASLIIALIWLGYIKVLDVFKEVKFISIILTLGISVILIWAVFPVSEFLNSYFQFQKTGGIIDDFWYCVMAIGMVEESVKLLPWLIVIKLFPNTSKYNILALAGVSAIGFAFIENISYIYSSYTSISGRAFLATVGHVFDASIPAYFYIFSKGNKAIAIFKGWLWASLAHGFYDYWLINESARIFWFISIVFAAIGICVWMIMVNNTLNFSENKQKLYKAEASTSFFSAYLLTGIVVVFLVQYFTLFFNYGQSLAFEELKFGLIFYSPMIITLVTNTNKIEINPMEKRKLNDFKFEKIFSISSLTSKEVYFAPVSGQFVNHKFTSTIIERIKINGEYKWFVVKLSEPIVLNGSTYEYCALKSNHPGKSVHTYQAAVSVRVIQNIDLVTEKATTSSNAPLWCSAKIYKV